MYFNTAENPTHPLAGSQVNFASLANFISFKLRRSQPFMWAARLWHLLDRIRGTNMWLYREVLDMRGIFGHYRHDAQ